MYRPTQIPFAWAACALLATAGAAVADDHSFTFTELGTLGGSQAVAFGLNDNRQVVGWALVPGSMFPHAFLWEDGVMRDLGILDGDEQSTALAINNDGVIVGISEYDAGGGYMITTAFVYSNDHMTALPGLGGNWARAAAINSSGIIAGMAENTYFKEQAVIWDSGNIVEIGQHSTQQYQRAYGINDAGITVGWEYTPMMGANDAFMFDGSHWTVIGGTDSDLQNAEAWDINENNVVVGLCNFPEGLCTAAMWLPENPTEPINLGTLPGYDDGQLFSVNNSNHAVGFAMMYFPVEICHAILYDGAVLHDLNDFLPADFDGYLWDAMGINDNGDIIAVALTSTGWSAYLLTPEESCPADLNDDDVVDIDDLFAVLGAWGTCDDCPEDLNDDGVVDIDDLFAVLGEWGPCP
ncbi:MAG: DUF3466 family protein [Phycisphaerales bacterium]|nr:MAG: DUF3466 family protein [Phycisphaerales bacterium]